MRRKQPRVVWIPTTPEQSVDAGGVSSWSSLTVGGLDQTVPGSSIALEAAVVLDGAQSGPLDLTSSLSDIENSGYRLRRIVGKIFVFIQQDTVENTTAAFIGVTAGFMVRRTDPGTGSSLAASISQANINPATVENNMDPWIWRRSWLLGTGPSFANDTLPLDAETAGRLAIRNRADNATGLSALDGPHIDQKTARIIGPEERLFLDVSATVVVPGGGPLSSTMSLLVVTELRVLGSMRTSSGNRRNASR